MGVVFAHHLAALGHPPTDDDFVNFGFEDLVKKYYEQNRAIVRTQAHTSTLCKIKRFSP